MSDIRIKKVHNLLVNNNCDGCLFTDSVDVQYISGFHSSNVAVLITESQNVLFSDFRYKSAGEHFVKKNPKWKFVCTQATIAESLKTFIPAGSVIAFQPESMFVDYYNKLKKACRKVTFLPIPEAMTSLFTEKSAAELKAMKHAAEIADSCFAEFIENISPEMTEREAACKLDMLCLGAGSESPAFDTIVLAGPNAAHPHGRPGATKLSSGKLIVVDFGCTYKGFRSDMTRTFAFGTVNERIRKIYSIVLEAQIAACKKAKAGMFTDELDAVARSIIEKSGFGNYFGHGLGHGVGLNIHEYPRVSSKAHVLLVENSVITIEPGIYVPGLCGVRIEDMVRVKKDGIEIISKTPKELLLL